MTMNAQQLSPLSGYAQEFGTKKAAVCELSGPAAYVAAGQTVYPGALGWGGFDLFQVSGLSHSGTYYARIQYLPIDATPSAMKGAVRSVKVLWFVVATGVEVAADVDLSAEVVRVFALGV